MRVSLEFIVATYCSDNPHSRFIGVWYTIIGQNWIILQYLSIRPMSCLLGPKIIQKVSRLSEYPEICLVSGLARLVSSASKSSIRRFVITEEAPSRAFSWLKAATTAFTFKTLLRHYAKQALTPRSPNAMWNWVRDAIIIRDGRL